MPVQLRYQISTSGPEGSETFHCTVEQWLGLVGWVPQQSFTAGTAKDAVGQATDFADETYPDNEFDPTP